MNPKWWLTITHVPSKLVFRANSTQFYSIGRTKEIGRKALTDQLPYEERKRTKHTDFRYDIEMLT